VNTTPLENRWKLSPALILVTDAVENFAICHYFRKAVQAELPDVADSTRSQFATSKHWNKQSFMFVQGQRPVNYGSISDRKDSILPKNGRGS
jgi:hypothetical protein